LCRRTGKVRAGKKNRSKDSQKRDPLKERKLVWSQSRKTTRELETGAGEHQREKKPGD